MHILIIPSFYPNFYNSIQGIFFKIQAKALKDKGHTIGLIAPLVIWHNLILKKKKIKFGNFHSIDPFPTYLFTFPSFPIIKAMNDELRLFFGKKLFRRYVRKFGRPDLVHVHSFENGILARWIQKNYQLQYVITEHSTGFFRNEYPLWKLKLARRAYEYSKQIITVSPHLNNTLQKLFDIDPIVIPNMVDTDYFEDRSLEKKYDFISIGGLRLAKNYHLLLKAFSKLQSEHPATLAIIGEGPLRGELERQIEELKLTANVFLLGQQSQEAILQLLNQSKIFISSSTIETFGIAIIEAMSCGMPAIATKSGGPEYSINDPKVGMLCEHTTASLSKAMSDVYQSLDDFDPLYIRNYVIERFSPDTICEQLEEVYSQVPGITSTH